MLCTLHFTRCQRSYNSEQPSCTDAADVSCKREGSEWDLPATSRGLGSRGLAVGREVGLEHEPVQGDAAAAAAAAAAADLDLFGRAPAFDLAAEIASEMLRGRRRLSQPSAPRRRRALTQLVGQPSECAASEVFTITCAATQYNI